MAMESRKYQVARSLRRVDEALAIQRERLQEALKIFIPTEIQQPIADCKHRTLLLSGGNRSSKTTTAAYVIASWLLGKTEHPNLPKAPDVADVEACKKFDGRAYLVGKDATHLGEVMYRKLFRHGAFKVIKDEQTGLMRAYLPWKDAHRSKEVKPGPAFIPHRFIESQSYRLKKDNVPRMVRLKNGWEVMFFTGEGVPAQGFDVNLCLAGWSKIYDPVADEYRQVDQIKGLFHVASFNESTGRLEVQPASQPFIKGFGEICRVRLRNGQELITTRHHQVLSDDGWVSVQQAYEQHLPLRACREVSLLFRGLASQATQSKLHTQTSRQVQASCACHTAVEVRFSEEFGYCSSSVACFCKHLAAQCQCRICLDNHEPGMKKFHTSFQASEFQVPCTQQEQFLEEAQKTWQSVPVSSSDPVCGLEYLSHATRCERCRQLDQNVRRSLSHPLRCTTAEGVRYQPDGQVRQSLAYEDSCEQPLSSTQDCLCRCSAYCDPCGEPLRRHEAGDQGSLPSPSCVQEPCRSSWRLDDLAHKPRCNPYRQQGGTLALDLTLQHLTYVVDIETIGNFPIWDISVAQNHNYVYGNSVSHNCWFDEEIEARDWVHEAKRGLVDRGGVFVWSATPQAATDQFLNLLDQAEVEGSTVAKFIMPSYSNPHISKEEIDAFSEGLTEDERKVRIQGEPATASFLMYPTFDMSYIGMSWDRLPKKEIPEDWTRYAAIDPGYGVTAVVFFAVPPPSSSYGDIVVAYDELYITKCTSEKFAEAMALKMGKFEFQAFLIDDKQAAKTETTGKTIKQQLAEALRERNVSSVCGGFIPGEVDNEAGCHAVRDALRPRSGLGPKYRIMEAACPNLERNFQKLRRKRIRGASGDWVYKDVPADNQDDHAFDCFRYMVCFDPRWVEPTPRTPPKPWALLRYELKQKKNGGNKRCVTLGPPQKRR